MLRRRHADLVRVHSECVQYLIRLGWSLPLVEPDRKSRVREGDGLSLAANLTADHNSDFAIDDTRGILHLILAKSSRSDAFFAVWPTYFYGTLVLRKRGEKELACERS